MLRATLLRSLALTLLMVLTAAVLSAQGSPSPQLIWNGYVQGRYSDMLGENTTSSTFEARRVYLNVRAVINPQVSATILINGLPTTSILEAYGEYRFSPELTGRLGMVRVPFGYETPLTSSRLITLERSQAAGNLMARDFTFERGLFAYYTPTNSPLSLSAAVVNGTFTSTPTMALSPEHARNTGANDPNDGKNLAARLACNIPGGQIAASIYTGTHPLNDEPINRIGMDLLWAQRGITVLGEIMQGRGNYGRDPDERNVGAPAWMTWDPTIDSRGGYLTVAYQLPNSKFQPYLRYDCFDVNRDIDDNEYARGTIGVNYRPNNQTRVTVEYQTITDDASPNVNGAIGAQYQVGF